MSTTMDIFQTYKALILKKTWKKDLKEIQKKKEQITYKWCMPWKKFLGLSIELGLLFTLFFTIVGFKAMGLISVMTFPFIIIMAIYFALHPLVFILLPLGLYNIIKIQINKRKVKNKSDLKQINQKQEMVKQNLQTIQKALKEHSVVPLEYQTENQLNRMMTNIKHGKANNDSHAIYLHAIELDRKEREKTRQTEQEFLIKSERQSRRRALLQNLTLLSFLFYLFKKK